MRVEGLALARYPLRPVPRQRLKSAALGPYLAARRRRAPDDHTKDVRACARPPTCSSYMYVHITCYICEKTAADKISIPRQQDNLLYEGSLAGREDFGGEGGSVGSSRTGARVFGVQCGCPQSLSNGPSGRDICERGFLSPGLVSPLPPQS